jgi:capsid assembly protease
MWLLKQETAVELARLERLHPASTPEQRAQFNALHSGTPEAANEDGGILSVAGTVAEISIRGILTQDPSFIMWFFGIANTAYRDVISALGKAASNPAVSSVVLRVDSPGGTVSGLFDTLAAIQRVKKPITVLAAEACSAAYAIAAVAGKITATSAAASIGSIGVAATFLVSDDIVELTSTEAPDKRPDVRTEEGKAVVVKYLDAIHDLFADAIAKGRGTTVDDVNENFGRGATMLAGDAKKRGMIDAAPPPLRIVRGMAAESDHEHAQLRAVGDNETTKASSQESEAGEIEMDLKTLRAQHPQLCEELLREGEERGTAQERKRVSAHVKMAKTTGAIEVAHEAILAGKSVHDDDVHADYFTAAMNRRDIATRQEESDKAGEATENAETATTAPDLGDLVAAKMLAERGKSPKAVTHG